jgi:hypothetical protein
VGSWWRAFSAQLKRRVSQVDSKNRDTSVGARDLRMVEYAEGVQVAASAPRAMMKRDGWAVDETKKDTASRRGECASGDELAGRPPPVEEEHRQQHESETEEVNGDRF